MNVGVMKDYKLRDLRASHTLGYADGATFSGTLCKEKKKSEANSESEEVLTDRRIG
jgi:hypothetical protein